MAKLNIGIVGCGEVTQTIHLPILQRLRDEFLVTALCDVSPQVLAGVGASVPSAALYMDVGQMIAEAPVDAVLVANPHALHADTALSAIAAGKHVLVEKPLCLTLEEADALSAAAGAANVIVQVGYMRRYAPGFIEAVEQVVPLRGAVRHARFQDVIGNNSAIVNSAGSVLRAADIPPEESRRIEAIAKQRLHSLHGSAAEPLPNVYSMLLGLGSHDLSAMRELLGMPQGVLYAAQNTDGRYLSAAFDYGNYVADFVAGVDNLPRYDTFCEIFTDDQVIRVSFDAPYILNQPARLRVTTADGEAGVATRVSFSTRRDSFHNEWVAFRHSVLTNTRPKADITDARQDLLLIRQMLAAMAPSSGEHPNFLRNAPSDTRTFASPSSPQQPPPSG